MAKSCVTNIYILRFRWEDAMRAIRNHQHIQYAFAYIDFDSVVDRFAASWRNTALHFRYDSSTVRCEKCGKEHRTTWANNQHIVSIDGIGIQIRLSGFRWCCRYCRLHIMTSPHKRRSGSMWSSTWKFVLILANGFRNSHSHARLHDFLSVSLVLDRFFMLLRFQSCIFYNIV